MDTAFEKAVERFRGGLTKRQQEQFFGCKKQDVERIIQDIQSRHGAQKRLKSMRRVSKFIEAMSQLGQVIEVFLNVHNSVAFVWGPIKFILVVTLPGLTQYTTLYSKYPSIQNHLENYYLDVLEFNKNALEVFARPGWKSVFHSSWRTFRSQFGPILSNFKRHRQLLADEKTTALMSEVQDLHHHAEERFNSLESEITARHEREVEKEVAELEESRQRQRRIVQRKLDAPDSLKDHEHACGMREIGNSGDWIIRDSKYQKWAELDTYTSKWLYLNGIPGVGKTILASRIIDHLKGLQTKSKDSGRSFPVIYFYFKHLHEKKRQMSHLVLSLLSQLGDQDSTVLDLFYKEVCLLGQQQLSPQRLCELASTALRAQRRCFIVVDGLDECGRDPPDSTTREAVEVLKWFEDLMIPGEEATSETDNVCIRLLISGQRDGSIEQRLESVPSIQLEMAAGHGEDIKSYASVEARKICQQFSSSLDVEQDLVQKVVTRAKGMFLFAKVVLDNLSDQISAFDFEAEMRAENFPEGLDKAYERVVKRILKNRVKPERLAAQHILGWVICAQRPLRWREIQSRFCIDPSTETANAQKKPIKSCKRLCGSLVEVQTVEPIGGLKSEGEVEIEIVHPSAKEYLVHTGAICLATENAKMALFCTQYLTSTPFQISLESKIQTCALTGYYGFHDYAVAFWWHHVDKAVDISEDLPLETFRSVLKSVAKLLRKSQSKRENSRDDPGDLETIVKQFRELPRNSRDRQKVLGPLGIEISTGLVRDAIEALRSKEIHSNTIPLYGPIRYKCPKPWCQLFATGFVEAGQRKDHVNEHERPFRCDTEGCFQAEIGFSTGYGLRQHIKKHHTEPEIVLFPKSTRFPKPTDSRPDSRKDNPSIWATIRNDDLNGVKNWMATRKSAHEVMKTEFMAQTPLLIAVELRHLRICKYLLANGADVNYPHVFEDEYEYVLHAAVRQDDLNMTNLLLDQEILKGDLREQELTALQLAAKMGHHRLLASFKTKKPEFFDFTACLHQAVEHDRSDTVQELMKLKDDNIDLPLTPRLINNLGCVSDSMIRLLMSFSWQSGTTMTYEACRFGTNVGLIHRLLALSDDPIQLNQATLDVADARGFHSVVSAILASKNLPPSTKAHYSLSPGNLMGYHLDALRACLTDHPHLLTRADVNGTTLLHNAILAAKVEMVKLLLEMDVDVNARPKSYPHDWGPFFSLDATFFTPLVLALAFLDRWERDSSALICKHLAKDERVKLSFLSTSIAQKCLATALKHQDSELLLLLVKRDLLNLSSSVGRSPRRENVLATVLHRNAYTLMTLRGDEVAFGHMLRGFAKGVT
ncbi:hypothetical protein BKA65DRAFT_55430 [Rhexocercosporidium sp. MPI-PUGE-AT-0058]|nr:hypothetical protein BKA65DRAFT_55430 [Rhexocercosporidium sp. MPI-PUGE-AT-0058]